MTLHFFILAFFFGLAAIMTLVFWIITAREDAKLSKAQIDHEKRLFDIRNGLTPEAIEHKETIEKFRKQNKEITAQLEAMKNCPKFAKLKNEINQEYLAMIKGRKIFAAIQSANRRA